MNSLTHIDKRYLETILEMGDGYVLNFSNLTFGKFFARHNVNIHGPKYRKYGTSKAKNMRSFWDQEPDELVGQVLSEMLDEYEADCDIYGEIADRPILEKARGIVGRLLGIVQEVRPERNSPNLSPLGIRYSERSEPSCRARGCPDHREPLA